MLSFQSISHICFLFWIATDIKVSPHWFLPSVPKSLSLISFLRHQGLLSFSPRFHVMYNNCIPCLQESWRFSCLFYHYFPFETQLNPDFLPSPVECSVASCPSPTPPPSFSLANLCVISLPGGYRGLWRGISIVCEHSPVHSVFTAWSYWWHERCLHQPLLFTKNHIQLAKWSLSRCGDKFCLACRSPFSINF